MTPDTAFLTGLEAFGSVVERVPADAWDLAKGAGVDYALSVEAADFGRALIEPMGEQSRQRGVFGPALEAPAGAGEADRFLAWTGRSVG